MSVPALQYPRHPAHLAPYVDVLGPQLALKFLIEFAGARLYFPQDPKGKSAAERMIGRDLLEALGRRLGESLPRVPVARTWMIHALKAEGRSNNEICRTIKVSDETVRKALMLPPNGASHPAELDADPGEDPQLRLF